MLCWEVRCCVVFDFLCCVVCLLCGVVWCCVLCEEWTFTIREEPWNDAVLDGGNCCRNLMCTDCIRQMNMCTYSGCAFGIHRTAWTLLADTKRWGTTHHRTNSNNITQDKKRTIHNIAHHNPQHMTQQKTSKAQYITQYTTR